MTGELFDLIDGILQNVDLLSTRWSRFISGLCAVFYWVMYLVDR